MGGFHSQCQVRGLQALVSPSDVLAYAGFYGWVQTKESNSIFYLWHWAESSQLYKMETFTIKDTYIDGSHGIIHIAVKPQMVCATRNALCVNRQREMQDKVNELKSYKIEK